MRHGPVLRGLAALIFVSACGSSPAFEREEPSCGGVLPPPPCDIEPSATCLGSALPRITERDGSNQEVQALRMRMESGTTAIARKADGSGFDLVPDCRLDGGYQEILGEEGSGRLWVAERVLFGPAEVGAPCDVATHTIVALAIGAGGAEGAAPFVALLTPLPCPSVDERKAASGCIGKGLNGAERVYRAAELYESFRAIRNEERGAEPAAARTFAGALELYALAPDHREDDRLPRTLELLDRLDYGRDGDHALANESWVAEDLNQVEHTRPPPRFDPFYPPVFLDCFAELFDPAIDAYVERNVGGSCWRPASAGPPPPRTDPTPAATAKPPAPPPSEANPEPDATAKPPGETQKAPATRAPDEAIQRLKKLRGSGDPTAMKAALDALRLEYPGDARLATYLGNVLRAMGDPRAAIRAYGEALALDANERTASVELAKLLYDAGDLTRTLEVVTAALKREPDHAELLEVRAQTLDALSRTKEALAAYPAALKGRPDDPALHVGYGALLSEAGRGREALAELGAGMTTTDPKLLARAAEAFANQGAFADCIRALDKALGVQSVYREKNLVRRAACKDGLHDEAGAAKDYEAALTSFPNDPVANLHYGLHLAAKNPTEALERFDRAARIAGERGVGPEARTKAAKLRAKP